MSIQGIEILWERLGMRKWLLWKVPTHPPLYSNEEETEGLGLWKEEVQALQKVLKSQLSLSYGYQVQCSKGMSQSKLTMSILF
jgi:hypothetical protein